MQNLFWQEFQALVKGKATITFGREKEAELAQELLRTVDQANINVNRRMEHELRKKLIQFYLKDKYLVRVTIKDGESYTGLVSDVGENSLTLTTADDLSYTIKLLAIIGIEAVKYD